MLICRNTSPLTTQRVSKELCCVAMAAGKTGAEQVARVLANNDAATPTRPPVGRHSVVGGFKQRRRRPLVPAQTPGDLGFWSVFGDRRGFPWGRRVTSRSDNGKHSEPRH
jgi:hypothetical protein